MSLLPSKFKKEIAALYIQNRKNLEQLNPTVLNSFANNVLAVITQEKEKSGCSHDLTVLEESMKHLKKDSSILKNSQPKTDDYDFSKNDCNNLIHSMTNWLKAEKLI